MRGKKDFLIVIMYGAMLKLPCMESSVREDGTWEIKDMRRKKPTLGQLLFGHVRGVYRRAQIVARMIAFALVLVIVLTVTLTASAISRHKAAVQLAEERLAKEKDVTIGATGCMLLHQPFLNYYWNDDGDHDFSDCFKYIAEDYKALDYMTCEMEGSITDDKNNYSSFPSFRGPSVIINNLKDAGIDLQLTATNHVFDGGDYGFDYMLRAYDEAKIPMIGIVANEGDKRYYIADVKGVKVGYIDYTYGQQDNFNTIIIPDEYVGKINMFDEDHLDSLYERVKEDISGMKRDGAEFIVANMHWGYEYETQQDEYQEEIARKFCDMGVDALIGGHPHVVQPVDYLTTSDGSHGMFIIYSVGNTLSNQMATYMDETMPSGHTEDGVLVTMKLHKDADDIVTLTDVDLLPTWCHRVDVYNGSEDDIDNLERAYYYILPLDDIDNLESLTGIAGIKSDAQASYNRTMEILGPGLNKAKAALAEKNVENEND